ncbi:unnamed protein product, partial [Urochloa humidicola]
PPARSAREISEPPLGKGRWRPAAAEAAPCASQPRSRAWQDFAGYPAKPAGLRGLNLPGPLKLYRYLQGSTKAFFAGGLSRLAGRPAPAYMLIRSRLFPLLLSAAEGDPRDQGLSADGAAEGRAVGADQEGQGRRQVQGALLRPPGTCTPSASTTPTRPTSSSSRSRQMNRPVLPNCTRITGTVTYPTQLHSTQRPRNPWDRTPMDAPNHADQPPASAPASSSPTAGHDPSGVAPDQDPTQLLTKLFADTIL